MEPARTRNLDAETAAYPGSLHQKNFRIPNENEVNYSLENSSLVNS